MRRNDQQNYNRIIRALYEKIAPGYGYNRDNTAEFRRLLNENDGVIDYYNNNNNYNRQYNLLQCAIQINNADIVRLLIDAGINVNNNNSNRNYGSYLSQAFQQNNADIVRLLINAGFNVNDNNVSFQYAKWECLLVLLEHGVDADVIINKLENVNQGMVSRVLIWKSDKRFDSIKEEMKTNHTNVKSEINVINANMNNDISNMKLNIEEQMNIMTSVLSSQFEAFSHEMNLKLEKTQEEMKTLQNKYDNHPGVCLFKVASELNNNKMNESNDIELPYIKNMQTLLHQLIETFNKYKLNEDMLLPSVEDINHIVWLIQYYNNTQWCILSDKNSMDRLTKLRNDILIPIITQLTDDFCNVEKKLVNHLSNKLTYSSRLKILIHNYEEIIESLKRQIHQFQSHVNNDNNKKNYNDNSDNDNNVNDWLPTNLKNLIASKRSSKNIEKQRKRFINQIINGKNVDITLSNGKKCNIWCDQLKYMLNIVDKWPETVEDMLKESQQKVFNGCHQVKYELSRISLLFEPNVNDRPGVFDLSNALNNLEQHIDNERKMKDNSVRQTNPMKQLQDTICELYIDIVNRRDHLVELYNIMTKHIHSWISLQNDGMTLHEHITNVCEEFDKKHKLLRRKLKEKKFSLELAIEDDEPIDDIKEEVNIVTKELVNIQNEFHNTLNEITNKVIDTCPEIIHSNDNKYKRVKEFFETAGLARNITFDLLENVSEIIINDAFDSSRHRIFKGSIGGNEYALKAFSKNKYHRLLKEASVLKLLKHPYIVEICGVIKDREALNVYLMMPYYSHGALQQFMNKNDNIDYNQISILMKQVALGIKHIHDHGVIHCDIKPQNIFLENDLHIRIGDFDVSKTSEERATLVAGHKSTLVGYTQHYVAPEVLNEKAIKASDIYSFGLVLLDLHGTVKQRPCEENKWQLEINRDTFAINLNQKQKNYLIDLLKQILQLNPSNRLSIDAILNHSYFHENDVQLQRKLQSYIQKEKELKGKQHQCVLCFETYYEIDGVLCPANTHFTCDECFSMKCEHDSTDHEGRTLRKGYMFCPNYTLKDNEACKTGGHYSDDIIARHVDENVFKEYMKCRRSLIEAQLSKQYEAKLQKEMDELIQMDEKQRGVRRAIHHITNNILTLKCPNPNGCGQAFRDFSGCFALTCFKCNGKFCAWCLAWCNNDAHTHVRNCEYKLNNDAYYGTPDEFDRAHRQRCDRLIRDYVSTLSEDIQNDVIQAIERIRRQQ